MIFPAKTSFLTLFCFLKALVIYKQTTLLMYVKGKEYKSGKRFYW